MTKDHKTEVGLSTEELRPKSLAEKQREAYANDLDRLRARLDKFVEVPCPACQSKDSGFAFKRYGFDYRTCARCETLFLSPRPTPEIMSSYYSDSENYKLWATEIFPASEASRKEKIHRPWLKRVLGYCRQFGIPTDSLLEVGGGFGTFSSLAMEDKAFGKVTVVEPTPELAEQCRVRGLDVIERRVEDVDDSVTGYDVVVSFEVVEHLFEPKVFISRCRKFLKKGGMLVLSCPNAKGFDIATLGSESLSVDVEHVNLFTPQSLSALLEQCGLKPVVVSTPGRLDAELVREAALEGKVSFDDQPLLKTVLLDQWETLGAPFQHFLADNNLSAHMWIAARNL